MATVTDFRMYVGFFRHRKTRQLKRAEGADGVLALLRLWEYASQNNHDGVLRLMTADDIAEAAEFEGDAEAFVKTLVRLHWLDRVKGVLVLHHWTEHQPHVADTENRARNAALNAHKRWHGERLSDDCTFCVDRAATGSADASAIGNAASIPISIAEPKAISNAPAVAVTNRSDPEPRHSTDQISGVSRARGRRGGNRPAVTDDSDGWRPPFPSQSMFQFRSDKICKWAEKVKKRFIPGEEVSGVN